MDISFKRVLLKLSGEALSAKDGVIDYEYIQKIGSVVRKCVKDGVQVAIVVGAGNIWRGRQGLSMDRVRADHMGMLATVVNALAIQDAFISVGLDTVVMSAVEMNAFCNQYTQRDAVRALESGKVVVFGAGTGNPFFSTDTTAALRAAEIDAEVILLAKKVDAVYSDDPETNPDAVRYDSLTHREVLEKDLKVMDSTAASLCRDNNIAIHVFALADEGNVMKAVCGEKIGTIVK